MKTKSIIILILFLSLIGMHISASADIMPVVFYLQNLPGERIGTDSDNDIITDLEADGFLVVPVDCSTYPQTSPELEEALMQFHLASPALLNTYETANLQIDYDRIFYIPAGYRIEREIPVWNIREHGAEGTLNRIMGVYNDYIVPTFGVTPVSSPDDMVGPNGEPIEYNLYMDIVYPSGTPLHKVPTLVNFASNLPRQKPFNPKEKLEVAYRAIFPIGFVTTGYAIAHIDHCYNPLARRDKHYGHFDDFSLDSTNGLYASRAFIRYLRKFADKYNLNTKFGVMGISKSSYSAMRIMHTQNAEQEEHLFFNNTPNTKPQPWEGYASTVDVGYTAAGNGVTRAPLYVDELTCPMITSCGKFDSYDQWVKYPSPVAYLNSIDVNHLEFWMEELGHTFPVMGTDYATEENRYYKFKQFFDHYLKPEEIQGLEVFYAYPRVSVDLVDVFGLSRMLPADNLLPQDMAGLTPYAPITVRFLSEIDTINLHQHLKVIDLETGLPLNGKWIVGMQKHNFEFTPQQNLKQGNSYRLKVETSLQDVEGHSLSQPFERDFTVNKGSFKSGDVFFDDFSRTNIAQGGIPTMNYTLHTNVDPPGTIESTNGILRIYNGNASANKGVAGSSYMVGDLSNYDQMFNPVLKENNTSEMIWTFNMRSMKQVLYSFDTDSANYALAVVLTATENDFLSPTCKGYAVTLRNMEKTNAVIRLEKFENGLGSDAGITSISDASESIKTDYASVKVTYNPKTDTWQLFYRNDGGAFKNPLVEDAAQGYLLQVGNDVVDNTYTSTTMSSFGFFLNHGFWSSGAQSIALFDNFKVFLGAESSDATLADIEVSLDGVDYHSLMMFDAATKQYQYYLTQDHDIPQVRATKFHSKASEPVIQQAVNLRGSIEERTSAITVAAEDGTKNTYSIEFIETDNIYQCGMGNANGTTSGGGAAIYVPDGWTHKNMYFSGVLDRGNNKYEGTASVRCALASTSSNLTLPPMKEIGILRFFVRKQNAAVEGNLKVSMQKDGGSWIEIADLGDVDDLVYREMIVPINEKAENNMLVRVDITKNGDVFSSEGYYFDDFSYTAYSESSGELSPENINYTLRPISKGFVIDVERALVQVYNLSGNLISSTIVNGSQLFKVDTSGFYLIEINGNTDRHIVKVCLN